MQLAESSVGLMSVSKESKYAQARVVRSCMYVCTYVQGTIKPRFPLQPRATLVFLFCDLHRFYCTYTCQYPLHLPGGLVPFVQVIGDSTNDASQLMKREGVRSVPSFHFWKDGKKVRLVAPVFYKSCVSCVWFLPGRTVHGAARSGRPRCEIPICRRSFLSG